MELKREDVKRDAERTVAPHVSRLLVSLSPINLQIADPLQVFPIE
jgi:hypothetical protein